MKNIIKNYWENTLLILIAYFSSYPVFLLLKSGFLEQESITFYVLISFFATIGMILIPLYTLKKRNGKFEDFGFRLPQNIKSAALITIGTTIFFLVLAMALARSPEFQKYYMIKQAISAWFIVEIILSLIYFISEEFFFRGYLLFDLLKKKGLHTIWISSLIFSFLHIGKPTGEIFFAFFVGIILGIISYKTKSFIPAAIIHFCVALGLNLIIIFLQ